MEDIKGMYEASDVTLKVIGQISRERPTNCIGGGSNKVRGRAYGLMKILQLQKRYNNNRAPARSQQNKASAAIDLLGCRNAQVVHWLFPSPHPHLSGGCGRTSGNDKIRGEGPRRIRYKVLASNDGRVAAGFSLP